MRKNSFGEMIRELRKQRGDPLRVVAAAVEIDTTLLSKLERGERFPTEQQVNRLARHFNVAVDELRARAIADKIIYECGTGFSVLRAVELVKEHIGGTYRAEGRSNV